MQKRQKKIVRNFLIVVLATVVVTFGMINIKDWVSRSESMRAMESLGQEVLRYRNQYGSVPPEGYIGKIKEQLEGQIRLGKLNYRARWISFGSQSDSILAYSRRKYHSFLFHDDFVVLRLDGTVERLSIEEFRKIFNLHRGADEGSPFEE